MSKSSSYDGGGGYGNNGGGYDKPTPPVPPVPPVPPGPTPPNPTPPTPHPKPEWCKLTAGTLAIMCCCCCVIPFIIVIVLTWGSRPTSDFSSGNLEKPVLGIDPAGTSEIRNIKGTTELNVFWDSSVKDLHYGGQYAYPMNLQKLDSSLHSFIVDGWDTYKNDGTCTSGKCGSDRFEYVETHQLIRKKNPPVGPDVDLSHDVNLRNKKKCNQGLNGFRAFHKNGFKDRSWCGDGQQLRVNYKLYEPAHVTIVPCTLHAKSPGCDTFDHTSAYMLFVSAEITAKWPNTVKKWAKVIIKDTAKLWDSAEDDSSWYNAQNMDITCYKGKGKDKCGGFFARPQWYKKGNVVGYAGTLPSDRAQGFNVVEVAIDDLADIDVPITNSYWEIDLKRDLGLTDSEIKVVQGVLVDDHGNNIKSLNKQRWVGFKDAKSLACPGPPWSTTCGNRGDAWMVSAAKGVPDRRASAPADVQYQVHGYGRVAGTSLLSAFGSVDSPKQGQPPPPPGDVDWPAISPSELCTTPGQKCDLARLLMSGEYRVRSGLLELSAGPGTNWVGNANNAGVDVWGVQVGYPPKRGQGSVQLNGYAVDQWTRGRGCKTFDLKMPGGWVEASDGAELLGVGSLQQYSFFHIADDSIKVGAERQEVTETTVLQGNVGAVVNPGSYDLSPNTITKATVDGVYVHRIVQRTGQYDGYGGMIASRNAVCGRSVTGVAISRLYVPSLGGVEGTSGGLKGPNTIYRIFSLGFLPNSYFGCNSADKTPNDLGVSITNSDVFTDQVGEALLVNANTKTWAPGATGAGIGCPKCKLTVDLWNKNAPDAQARERSMLRIWRTADERGAGNYYTPNAPNAGKDTYSFAMACTAFNQCKPLEGVPTNVQRWPKSVVATVEYPVCKQAPPQYAA